MPILKKTTKVFKKGTKEQLESKLLHHLSLKLKTTFKLSVCIKKEKKRALQKKKKET